MKKQKIKRFLNLDYTTALIVSALLIFLISLTLVFVVLVKKHIRTTSDHTRPLNITNLPYCSGEKLDLTVPPGDKPAPLVIYIHGGGWQYGSKATDNVDFLTQLIPKGFAVASINYRLSDSAKFPAAVQDVLCAVRFMRANHELFNIDQNKIALAGYSSGGHLAALSGMAADNPEFTKGQYNEYDNKVQAVITLAAHLDLSASNFTEQTEGYLASWLKNTDDRARANPKNYLDKDDPAILVLHGRDDEAVPFSQAEAFKSAADTVGLPATLLPVQNGGHSFSDWLGRDAPNSQERFKIINSFLREQLQY